MSETFMKYLIDNSIVDKKFPSLAKREKLIGRKRPKYCELHESLYLDTKQGEIVADHNHKTGKYRGWVCQTCNTGLLPEIDRLINSGIDAEDIKIFLNKIVDYVTTDGENIAKLFAHNKPRYKDLEQILISQMEL